MTTRQKSCGACFRAKRKCDLRIPKCARCRVKNIDCEYKTAKGDGGSSTRNNSVISCLTDGKGTAFDTQGFPSSFEFNLDPNWLNDSPSPVSYPNPFECLNIPLEQASMNKMIPDSYEYCGTQLKSFPEKFARSGSTPFIHGKLYQENIPSSIRRAFSTCAMYGGRNKSNIDMTYQVLDAEVSDLLQSISCQTSFEDLLAPVQALILYQIIRLFDGDVRQRSFAEQHDSILAAWTDTLHLLLNQVSSSSLVSSAEEKWSWKSWILMESARRTILMSFFLRGFYYGLRTGFCNNLSTMLDLPISTRAILWKLESPARWQLALKAAEPELIPYRNFTPRLIKGELSLQDLDVFQRLLAVACVGINKIEQTYLERHGPNVTLSSNASSS